MLENCDKKTSAKGVGAQCRRISAPKRTKPMPGPLKENGATKNERPPRPTLADAVGYAKMTGLDATPPPNQVGPP